MTRFRKLDPRTGPIPYRDTWGRPEKWFRMHVRSRRQTRRRVLTALSWVAGAAAFVVVAWVALVLVLA